MPTLSRNSSPTQVVAHGLLNVLKDNLGGLTRSELADMAIAWLPPEVYMHYYGRHCMTQTQYFTKRNQRPYQAGSRSKTIEEKIIVGAKCLISQEIYRLKVRHKYAIVSVNGRWLLRSRG